ncbi:MAG: response regulator, partial [Gammaproteobacteria bacterium]|nr:response regulator [Gammaproteobacteria bacterium]
SPVFCPTIGGRFNQQVLEEEGYQVVTAYSAEEALDVAMREQPDIGLLDFNLPDFTGEELTRRLLAHPVTQNMVISIFSGYTDITRKSLDAGAVDMISKDSPEELFLLRIDALKRRVLSDREKRSRPPSEAAAQPLSEVKQVPPFKVLFVDDSKFVRSAYQAMLEESGCEVVAAESMTEALSVARNERPDLAIVDFYMEGGNGDELTRELLNDPATQNVMVVVLTSQHEVKDIALAAGAIDVIFKGEQQSSFIQRIASIRKYHQQIYIQMYQYLQSVKEAKLLYERVDAILNGISDPILAIDRFGLITHTNRASGGLLGVSPNEVLVRPFSDLFEDGADYHPAMLNKLGEQIKSLYLQDQAQFREQLQQAPLPSIIVDLQPSKEEHGRLGHWQPNREMERWLGYEQQALESSSLSALLSPEMISKIEQLLETDQPSMVFQRWEWRESGGEVQAGSTCMISFDGTQTKQLLFLVNRSDVLNQDLLRIATFSKLMVSFGIEVDEFISPSLSSDRRLRCCHGGTSIPVLASISPLTPLGYQDSLVDGAILVLHDLTTRLQEEKKQQYLAFQSGIADMSASILHNIGNALTGIGGQVSFINKKAIMLEQLEKIFHQFNERKEVDEATFREVMQTSTRLLAEITTKDGGIKQELKQITESIQEIAKIISVHRSTTKPELSNARIYLKDLVEDVLILLRDEIQQTNIKVRSDLDSQILVQIPRNPAMQMIRHLIQNSVEAIIRRVELENRADWQGEITISVYSTDEDQALFVLEDNGCGFSANQQPYLFTRGYTTKKGGSGFGLHSSGGFIQDLGGKLELTSGGEFRGAKARVTFGG